MADLLYQAYVEPLFSSVEEASAPSWQPPQQRPVPHRWFRPPQGRSAAGLEVALLEAPAAQQWQQPQQQPVPHQTAVEPTAGKAFLDRIAPVVDPLLEVGWDAAQQEPVPHPWFVPPSVLAQGPPPSSLEGNTREHWFQPQQSPTPHRWHKPPVGAVAGSDGASLEPVTREHWLQPQQRPVPHRWFRPPQGPASVGTTPALLEEVGRLYWCWPQRDPQPNTRRRVWLPQYAEGLDSNLFAGPETVTLDKWFQPAQEPIPHRWFRAPSGTANGAEPSLLEAVVRLWWQQPAQLPTPHRWFWPPSGAPTQGPDETTFAAAEAITLDKWFRPQQSPVLHRWFRPPSGGVAGSDPILLDTIALVLWYQPQSPPVPHRFFRPPSGWPALVLDPNFFVEELPPAAALTPQGAPFRQKHRPVWLDRLVVWPELPQPPTVPAGRTPPEKPYQLWILMHDPDIWDHVQTVTYTSTRRTGSLADLIQGCMRRQPSNRERAPSGGVYQGTDVVWCVPTKHVKWDRLKPGDVLEDKDGDLWTVLQADWAAERSFWRLYTVNLAIFHDLREKVTIQRPAISYDDSGVAVLTFPPAGGSEPYRNLAASVQPLEKVRATERLVEGFNGTHAITVSKQIDLQPYDRVKWVDGRVTRYFDINELRNPEQLSELPVIDAVLKA